ncbi:MAG TPA: A/G-specific adenine glycosylase [Candidatus Eremiobacteraceae bacterium]|jgi:A/G-specific adenine glycosylase|nr:A/G-specific adenine glycosylase [Candidatus Eremiobacteraceae bacterium]
MNSAARLRRLVLRWYRRHGRDLPWRRTHDPYAILVSEIMLQQTQVSRVIPKYRVFLKRFPSVQALACAQLRDVLRCWSGLGYNRRARNLWQCARAVIARHGGRMPPEIDALQSLPGIGRYTAGAVASFAFGAREAAVDTNVRRVLSRAMLGIDRADDATAWRRAVDMLPKDAATWNHALMDIGALFCRAKPNCAECPLRGACVFRRRGVGRVNSTATRPQGRFEGSRRQQRGRVIRALVDSRSIELMRLGPQVKVGFGKSDLPWLQELLLDLERDGLVALNRSRTRAALP